MTKFFNLSGHQNVALDEAGFIFPGIVQVDVNAPLTETAEKYLNWLTSLGIGSGDTVTVVLPGMSTLAGVAITAIHGLTGQFPNVVPLVRQTDGTFAPGTALDMQEFRNNICRVSRPDLIKL